MKNGTTARKRAAECMALAAKATGQQRTLLMAMARSWATLGNQIDRLSHIRQTLRTDTTEGSLRGKS